MRTNQSGDYKDMERHINSDSAEKKYLTLLFVSCLSPKNMKMRVLKNLPRASTSWPWMDMKAVTET
jgi:hypothetical protein